MKPALTYLDLVEQLRMRRIRLGHSQFDIDGIAGFQDGYTGKIERPNSSYGRTARWETLSWWMTALDVGLIVVPLSQRTRPKPRRMDDPFRKQLEFDFSSQ